MQVAKLEAQAKKDDDKVKVLHKKVVTLMQTVHKDKTLEAHAKDKEDAARELLASALVRRNRRAKLVDQVALLLPLASRFQGFSFGVCVQPSAFRCLGVRVYGRRGPASCSLVQPL